MYTCYFSNPNLLLPCLSDKDAVYLHESVVQGQHIYKRVWSSTVSTLHTRRQKRWLFCWVPFNLVSLL